MFSILRFSWTTKAGRQVSRFYDAHLGPTGLRITQFLTLLTLAEMPDVPMADLADRLDFEAIAMGKMAVTLERDGLVIIRRSPADGRSRIVKLSTKGRTLFEQAIPLWREAQRQFEELNGTNAIDSLRPGLVIPEL